MRINRLIFFAFLLTSQVFGVSKSATLPDGHRINQLVMQLPADNSADLYRIMEELVSFGDVGIKSITIGLVPPGKGDDSKQRYAISGLVKHVSHNNELYLRLKISDALCKAIEATTYDEVKDFLFQELQYVAGDESIITASSYLSHPRLSDPAARVLVRVNSEAAQSALLHNLLTTEMQVKKNVTQAIGETRYLPASHYLRELLENSSYDDKKVLLRSLAETADLSSDKLIALEAKNTGYNFEITDATGSYLLFLKRLAENGNSLFAGEQLEMLINNDRVPEHTRNAALSILDSDNFYLYTVDKDEQLQGFIPLFNGINLNGWTGNKKDYYAHRGMIICEPSGHGSGNLYTVNEYSDFILRFEFKLTPGANNGLGIRTPMVGDAAYVGMELQILDNKADIYKNLEPYQYHGSVYGVIPAERGSLEDVGEWNYQEVYANGSNIMIVLNGNTILDGDIAEASKNGSQTIDNRDHPGLLNKGGHIGFLGHGSYVEFRNIRIKEIK